jgi:excisionase family DNA binding protein
MPDRPPQPPPLAVVTPFVAALLERAVPSRQWRTHLLQLEQTSPALAEELRRVLAQLSYSAWWYRQHLERSRGETSAARTTEPASTEPNAGSERPLLPGTASVATTLRCSSRWVTQLIADGRLRAERVGRTWAIDPDSVDEFLTGSTT